MPICRIVVVSLMLGVVVMVWLVRECSGIGIGGLGRILLVVIDGLVIGVGIGDCGCLGSFPSCLLFCSVVHTVMLSSTPETPCITACMTY